MSSRKKFEPELIIHVTRFGVVKVRIPYTTLSEEKAGRELQARCSTIISLLSEVARGTAIESKPLIALPDQAPVTHATSQPHHPRQ
jgi:hypothetical protein